MGYGRLFSEEGFVGSNFPSAQADSLVDGIYSGGECIGPEKIGGISILQDGTSLVQYFSIRPLGNVILLGCVRYSQFDFYTILDAIVLEYCIDVFPPTVRSQYLHMCLVLIEEHLVHRDEPWREIGLGGAGIEPKVAGLIVYQCAEILFLP